MTVFDTIEKPTLLLDEERTRANIQRMADKARQQGIHFRPHFKTHQSTVIGEWFRPYGVNRITVSSLEMAAYFAAAGWQDITIAFPVNLRQATAIQQLAERINLGILVESLDAVHYLGNYLTAGVDVWFKIDTGARRTGLAWDNTPAAASLVRAAQTYATLRPRGLLTHAGNTYAAGDAAEVCRRYQQSVANLNALRDELHASGLGPLEISVGDTPGCTLCPELGPVDEIRPGNFVFYDAEQFYFGTCSAAEVSVAVACPLVALHPERQQAVIYGGAIHLSKDFFMQGDLRNYGYVALPHNHGWSDPLPGAYVAGMSQEHGILHLEPEQFEHLHTGDLVCILPAHSCLTVSAMRQYRTLSGEIIPAMNVL